MMMKEKGSSSRIVSLGITASSSSAFDLVNRVLTIKERGAEDGKNVGKREFLVPPRFLRIPPVRD
jgi:hypothetical protein